MSWYSELRQNIADKEIELLLRLNAPALIYRIYGTYAVKPLEGKPQFLKLKKKVLAAYAAKRALGIISILDEVKHQNSKERFQKMEMREALMQELIELGKEKPEIVIPLLAPRVAKENPFFQYENQEMLAQIGKAHPFQVCSALMSLLADDKETSEYKEASIASTFEKIGLAARPFCHEAALIVWEKMKNNSRYDLEVALTSLGRCAPDTVIPVIRSGLESNDIYSAGRLVLSILHMWSAAAPLVPDLIKLSESNLEKKKAAKKSNDYNYISPDDIFETLGCIGRYADDATVDAIINYMIEKLRTNDQWQCGDVAKGIRNMMGNGIKALPAIFDVLTRDYNVNVKQELGWAIEKLVEDNPEKAVPQVVEALKHSHGQVRCWAVEALTTQYYGGNNAKRQEIIRNHLIAALADRDQDHTYKWNIRDAFAKIDSEHIQRFNKIICECDLDYAMQIGMNEVQTILSEYVDITRRSKNEQLVSNARKQSTEIYCKIANHRNSLAQKIDVSGGLMPAKINPPAGSNGIYRQPMQKRAMA